MSEKNKLWRGSIFLIIWLVLDSTAKTNSIQIILGNLALIFALITLFDEPKKIIKVMFNAENKNN